MCGQIAILAEEGDDLSNLQPEPSSKSTSSAKPESASSSKPEAPSKSSSKKTESKAEATDHPSKGQDLNYGSAPQSPTSHSADPTSILQQTQLPSVARLLASNPSLKPSDLKGTGRNGRLTKADLLVSLGQIKAVEGSFTQSKQDQLSAYPKFATEFGKQSASKTASGPVRQEQIKSAVEFKRLIMDGMAFKSSPHPSSAPATSQAIFTGSLFPQVNDAGLKGRADADYAAIFGDYLPSPSQPSAVEVLAPITSAPNQQLKGAGPKTAGIQLDARDPLNELFA